MSVEVVWTSQRFKDPQRDTFVVATGWKVVKKDRNRYREFLYVLNGEQVIGEYDSWHHVRVLDEEVAS